jgi:hypothetical protein
MTKFDKQAVIEIVMNSNEFHDTIKQDYGLEEASSFLQTLSTVLQDWHQAAVPEEVLQAQSLENSEEFWECWAWDISPDQLVANMACTWLGVDIP